MLRTATRPGRHRQPGTARAPRRCGRPLRARSPPPPPAQSPSATCNRPTTFISPCSISPATGVIAGYADGAFRPYNNTTRAQQLRIVVLGFALSIATPTPGDYTFADVPPGAPFFDVIEAGAARQLVSGYTCGAPEEPCDAAHRPYFRPNAYVTRGQLSKIDVLGAGWPLQIPPPPASRTWPPRARSTGSLRRRSATA